MNSNIYDDLIRRVHPSYLEMLHAGINEIGAFCAAHECNDLKLLELGIGTGTQAQLLATEYPSLFEITAIDSDLEMIEGARKKLTLLTNVVPRFRVEPIEAIDWESVENAFSVVLANQVLHYLRDQGRQTALRGAFRALKAPGLLVYGDRVTGGSAYFSKRFDELVSIARREVDIFERVVAEPMDLPFFQYDDREHAIPANHLVSEILDAGFSSFEIVWRRLNYMVVAAIKETDR